MAGALPAMRRARGPGEHGGRQFDDVHGAGVRGRTGTVYADVVRVGNTSITVKIEVYTERNQAEPATVKVSEAQFVYVSLDEHGKPQPVDGPRSA